MVHSRQADCPGLTRFDSNQDPTPTLCQTSHFHFHTRVDVRANTLAALLPAIAVISSKGESVKVCMFAGGSSNLTVGEMRNRGYIRFTTLMLYVCLASPLRTREC